MNDYVISIKLSCACGAQFEINDVRGNREWITGEANKWQAKHADCARLKFPDIKIPKAKS